MTMTPVLIVALFLLCLPNDSLLYSQAYAHRTFINVDGRPQELEYLQGDDYAAKAQQFVTHHNLVEPNAASLIAQSMASSLAKSRCPGCGLPG